MNLDIEKERMEFLNFAPAPLPGYWCERQEREFAVWCAAKACATPSPAPIQQDTPKAGEATLRDWLLRIHDNELSIGDRLQGLSSRIALLLDGEPEGRYPPYVIREQDFCIPPSRAEPAGQQSLHAAIMNLPCKPREVDAEGDDWVSGYRYGHRDARHAAAELVSTVGADACDAARYRYLMRQMPCNIADLFGDCVAFDEVDEEIDAAIVLESEAGFPVPRVNGKD